MKNVIRWSWLVFILTMASNVFAATSRDYYQAGLRFYNQKQYNDAIRYFQYAVQTDPQNWQAYQGLGYSYYATGDKADAFSALDKSLSLNPNNPSVKQLADSLRGPASSTLNRSQSAGEGTSSVTGGGSFGLGLVLGDPGTFGASGKYWVDHQNAFQGSVKINGGTALQLDYLWHDYDLIHVTRGSMPFYLGLGGDLAFGGGSALVGANGTVGLTYLFQKKDVPLDLFVEVQPTLWFFSGGISFQLYGDLGSRFYF
jgi:tetratricopeptide (TPR) repeat protein